MNVFENECLSFLEEMRKFSVESKTGGISRDEIRTFLQKDSRLSKAIHSAYQQFLVLKKENAELLSLPEDELIEKLQEGYCNFYSSDALKPYVPLAGDGPWIVTTAGAVIFNVGGYGMISFGYNHPAFQKSLHQSHVMANMMTASFSQHRLIQKLRKEIGQRRVECPYSNFISLNSGSEAVTLALTLTDVNSKIQTDQGARHHGKKIMFMSLQGSFHGRTARAAKISDSTAKYYECLASFRDQRSLITVPINDCVALEKIFKKIDQENIFIDSFFMEPVMGEGNPGKAVDPHFYKLARKLTREHDTFFVVDSIQAGFRAKGYLSIVDYPGFEKLDAPDMETFAKSINGGEFPVSLVALTERTKLLYRKGIYGNTMTGNPRGLDMISAMLDQMTPEIRKNILERGEELKDKFELLKTHYPDQILHVQGTGLLLSMALDSERCPMMGVNGFERRIRQCGINVIHGGKNALRFTPCFNVTSEEIQLVYDHLNDIFNENQRMKNSTNHSMNDVDISPLNNAA